MATDPSIPLQFRGFDVGQIMDRAQQAQQQHYEMKRKKAADQREDEYRAALGDILTGNGSFQAPPAGQAVPPVMQGGMPASPQDRAARADPEDYLKFQGQQTQITAAKLKGYRDLNDTAMQLLGGVNDQATYDRAKVAAKVLYQRYGEDPSAIDQLPPEYSPDTVRSLQMQGMDTAHQLHQVAVENKLTWDMEDDAQDNNRAEEALNIRRRGQDMTDARVRRGQDMRGGGGKKGSTAPKNENALYTDIQRRFNVGEPVTDRERQFAHDYQVRHGGRGPKGRVSAGNGAIIVNPKTGQRMKLQNGQWVPIQ